MEEDKKENDPKPENYLVWIIISGIPVVVFVVWAHFKLGWSRVLKISWTANITVLRPLLLIVAAEAAAITLTFLVLRTLRPKRASVFVSYPHEQLAIASALVGPLTRTDLTPRMIPFIERPYAHNEVISEVVKNIRDADALVVVTAEASDTPSPRFYEAEILAASVSRKPVVLLGRQAEFQLPPTAYEGYPVLELSALQDRKYAPLADLVRYAIGTRETVTEALTAAIGASVETYLEIGIALLSWWWVSLLLMLAIACTVTWFRGLAGAISVLSASKSAFRGLLLVACIVVGFVSMIRQFRNELRVRRMLRDGFAERRMQNSELAALIRLLDSGEEIIASLLTPGLSRHSVDSADK
jgi:hypothetical protein